MSKMDADKLTLFEGKRIRKLLHEEQWWYSIVDVVAVLTDSPNPADYLKKMRKRDHMVDIELILTMLGEATTTKLHRDRDS
jgi:ferredoxin-fold anticodon binding domain-containing protein